MFGCAGQEQRKWLWNGKSMNWVSVDSSVFASVAYRGGQRQLFLRFHSGKVYRYLGFPPDQYDELLAAKSKGEYFAESIRGKFLYEEVREAHGSAG
jgi:KTSC domain